MIKTTRLVALSIGVSLVSGVGVATAGEKSAKAEPRGQDARLEKKLDAELQEDLRLARTGVDAAVKRGTVTLTGVVDTEADRVRAEELMRAQGVSKIDNRLTVLDAPTESDPSTVREEPDERRALSDPRRRDPLVGSMPAEQTGSREIRLRTMGVEDPRKAEPEKETADPAQPAPKPR
jgi:hypothetical protein